MALVWSPIDPMAALRKARQFLISKKVSHVPPHAVALELPAVKRHNEPSAVRHVRRNVETLCLAIIGCGAIAESAHIPAAARVDGVRLVGLVDTDLAHAQALASRYGVPQAVARLDDLVGKVDAVVLATPPHVRSTLAQQALEHGLHVLCEKPMANSSVECRQMIKTARMVQRTLAVAHTCRFLPNQAYAHNLFQSGRLGRLISARIEQGDPYSWPTRTAYTLRKEWVLGGVLFNEGVHILDMLFWWFGAPESFDYHDDSLGGLESNVRMALSYRDGGIVHYRLSRTCTLSNSVDMQFERAALSFPIYDMAALTVGSNGQSEQLTVHTKRWDFVEAVATQLQDFVSAALDGRPPTVPGEAGLTVVSFIESCYQQAAQRSRPVRAPLPGITW